MTMTISFRLALTSQTASKLYYKFTGSFLEAGIAFSRIYFEEVNS